MQLIKLSLMLIKLIIESAS